MSHRHLQRTGITRNQRAWLLLLGTTFLILGLGARVVRPLVKLAPRFRYLASHPATRTSWLSPTETGENPRLNEGATMIPVLAKQMWMPTGIRLETGEVVQVRAIGTVTSTLDRSDPAFRWIGPDGWGYEPEFMPGRFSLVLGPDSSFMCLIGRIGGTGTPFKLGARTIFQVRETGTLYLGINDALGPQGNADFHFRDNRGMFRVQVRVTGS